MIRRRLGQVLMVIALAFAAVSTAPVHAQEPSSITTPGTVTAATSLPHSFWIPGAANASKLTYWSTGPLNRPALSTGALFLPPRRSTRRRLAGHLVGSRHCRYFRPVRSHRDRDRWQSVPHELALAGLRDRRDRLRGTRHAGNPRVPGRTVGGAQRDRHGACRACGRTVALTAVDGHRKLPTGGHLWRILWPWFLPAYGQIVPHLL